MLFWGEDMTIRHLKIFRTVCENDCNITRAANKLHMTQPAVSQVIKELEEYYNVPLFDRVSRRLVITRAGEHLRSYALSIGNAFDDMEKEMTEWGKKTTIRIGCTFTIGAYFLPSYVKSFREIYKSVEVKCFCGPANILEQKILANELDFAFSEGVPQSENILSKSYMDDILVPFCSAKGKYGYGQVVELEDFKKENFILREKNSGTRKVFDKACENAGFSIEPEWESMSNTAIISAVMENLGVGVMSYRFIKHVIEEGGVVPFVVEELDLKRKFYVIQHKDKKLSDAAEYFLYLCNKIDFEIDK